MRFPDVLFNLLPALLVVWAVFDVRRHLRALHFYRSTAPLYTPKHLPFDGVSMPPAIQKADARLKEASFLPHQYIENNYPPIKLHSVAWEYVSAENDIYVTVNELPNAKRPVFVGFETWFPDDALLLTTFPTGETIQERDYHFRFAAFSIVSALTYHRYMLDRWRVEHGEPIKLRDAELETRLEAVFYRKYRRRMFQQQIRGQVVALAFDVVFGFASLLVLIFGFFGFQTLQRLPIPVLSAWNGMIGFGYIGGIIGILVYAVWSRSRASDTSLAVDAEFKQELTPNHRTRGQHPLEADPVEVDI